MTNLFEAMKRLAEGAVAEMLLRHRKETIDEALALWDHSIRLVVEAEDVQVRATAARVLRSMILDLGLERS